MRFEGRKREERSREYIYIYLYMAVPSKRTRFLGCGLVFSCLARRDQKHASGYPASLWSSPGAQGGRGSAGCHRAVREAPGPLTYEEGWGPHRPDVVGQPLATWTWCRQRPRWGGSRWKGSPWICGWGQSLGSDKKEREGLTGKKNKAMYFEQRK